MHLNVGATSHKIEEEVVHQKTSEATMGKISFFYIKSILREKYTVCWMCCTCDDSLINYRNVSTLLMKRVNVLPQAASIISPSTTKTPKYPFFI